MIYRAARCGWQEWPRDGHSHWIRIGLMAKQGTEVGAGNQTFL
jgi:hypothetical protein